MGSARPPVGVTGRTHHSGEASSTVSLAPSQVAGPWDPPLSRDACLQIPMRCDPPANPRPSHPIKSLCQGSSRVCWWRSFLCLG